MTTTAPAPTTTTARTRLTGSAGIAAGVCLVLGHALSVGADQPAEDYLRQLAAHRTPAVLGGLLLAAGAFLLLPALAGVLGLVRAKGSALATVAAVLTGTAATALGAGDVMITLTMGGLVEHHADTALAVVRATDTEPLLSLPFSLAPLIVAGFALLGVALLRARAVPAWTCVTLIAGGALILVSPGGGLPAAAAFLPLGVALAALGRAGFSARPAATPPR